jgi:hypothetical protein
MKSGQRASRTLAKVVMPQRLLALLPASAALWGVAAFPYAAVPLGIALALFAVVCVRFPAGWLWVVPALLPLLDLAPWSGRLFVQEIDLFLLVAVAGALWHGQYRAPRSTSLPRGFVLLLLVYTLSYLWSLYAGLVPLPSPGIDSFASYYSNYNALRVSRGLLWALLLARPLALLYRRDPLLAKRALLGGVALGLLGTGLVVLWERGVLHDLTYGRTRYELLRGLLDFTTPYRITGLLSGMHTGGESIDGYLALAWPCALAAALMVPRRLWPALPGALALPLALYACVVTFSRATYLALALTLAVFGAGLVRVAARRAGIAWTSTALGAGTALLAVVALAFRCGGILALVAVLFAAGLCALVLYGSRQFRPWVFGVVNGAGVPAAIALCVRAQVTSKWVPTDPATALSWSIGLVGLAFLCGIPLGVVARRALGRVECIISGLVVAVVCATIVPATLGYRMETRFSTVREDIQMRVRHWQDALALLPDDLPSALRGVGLGTFPRYHLLAYPELTGGIVVLASEAGNTWLRVSGGKDAKLSQRVDLPADRTYLLTLDYRLQDDEAWLRAKVCRRHLIHPTEFNGACRTSEATLRSTGGEWRRLELRFNLGGLGYDASNLWRPPLMLELANRREYRLMSRAPATLDIDNVSLRDTEGRDYLANGGFSAGMDRWFVLYDFNHLPWHIKNLALHLRFEQGWIGLVSFALLAAYGMLQAVRQAARGDAFAGGAGAAMFGFLAVGTVGTLLDEPRVILLYFLLLIAVAANGQSRTRVT